METKNIKNKVQGMLKKTGHMLWEKRRKVSINSDRRKERQN